MYGKGGVVRCVWSGWSGWECMGRVEWLEVRGVGGVVGDVWEVARRLGVCESGRVFGGIWEVAVGGVLGGWSDWGCMSRVEWLGVCGEGDWLEVYE